MSLESGSLNSIPYQSLESLKESYKKRLDGILNKQLTVENIEAFADEALSETIELTDEILEQYKNNPEFNSDTTLSTQQQEDEAFKILELPNLQEVLQSIINVKDKIQVLKEYINTNTENIDEVITPPQPDYPTKISTGSGEGMEKKMFPRLLTLLYIIEHDFDIKASEVSITKGVVTPNMVRKTSYVRVEIPDLKRVIYICDEEGNASYIFDIAKLTEHDLTLEEIDKDNKGDKNSLIAHYPGIGIRLVQSNNWRIRVSNALGEILPEIVTDIDKFEAKEEREVISEFRRERGSNWPSFDEFQSEVREFYPGEGNVQAWYIRERKNHKNWPSNPRDIYLNDGWKGYPELIGKENRLKKEYLDFLDFQNEVRSLYNGENDIEGWYQKEFPKHPHWPSKPYRTYKEGGWVGFPELAGVDNIKKKEFLPFQNFKSEIRDLYPGTGNVNRWYAKEKKKHPNWPSNPDRVYGVTGWVDWSELVGKENRFKKECPSFEDFQNKVRGLYNGEKNVQTWYKKISKDYPNWPSNPNQEYKNDGWEGYPELVGIENMKKKEFLSFEDFRSGVLEAYHGEKDVQRWYLREYKNHKNWPSNPNQEYKDKGWSSFPELVGKKKDPV